MPVLGGETLSVLNTVEDYVRWHPDVSFADVYYGLNGSIDPNRIYAALCKLYSMGIMRCRRGPITWNGVEVRVYFYTHVLTYRGPREDLE